MLAAGDTAEPPAHDAGFSEVDRLSAAGPLVAIEAAEDSRHSDPHAQAVRHGKSLLDGLDDLRLALIEGRLTRERLNALAGVLADQAPASNDPHLDGLLTEIELRVAVELARHGAHQAG